MGAVLGLKTSHALSEVLVHRESDRLRVGKQRAVRPLVHTGDLAQIFDVDLGA